MMMCLLQCASGYFRCSVYCSYNLNIKTPQLLYPTSMLYLAFRRSRKAVFFSKLKFPENIFAIKTWNSQHKTWHKNSQQFKKHMPANDSFTFSSFSCNLVVNFIGINKALYPNQLQYAKPPEYQKLTRLITVFSV